MKYFIFFLFGSLLCTASAQNQQTGLFKYHTDIGNPRNQGYSLYDPTDQYYTLRGSGYNIWFERDEFYFLYKELKGDFSLTANFKFKGEGSAPHMKTGWMLRASVSDDSPHISAVLHGDGLTVMQWRDFTGGSMKDPEDELFAKGSNYEIIQVERSGKIIFMRAAHPGEPLETIGSYEMTNLPDDILAGPFICSHNRDTVEEAIIWNVRIDKPVGDNYNPGKEGYLGCRLETMDVSLYKIPVTGGEIEKLNTGFADRNNNDHGISFNGKLLAISHQREGMPGGGSTVYVLPLKGGTPRMANG